MRLKTVELNRGAEMVGGFRHIGMREDAAKALEAWRDYLARRGVFLASSGGYRSYEENFRGRGRARVSWHNAGIAFDLYIWGGVVAENLPYAVSLLWEREGRARFSVHGRVLAVPSLLVPVVKLEELVRERRGVFKLATVEEPLVSLTETAREFGFEPILSRRGWRNEYLNMEWWHFNFVAVRPTTWGKEMEKLGFSPRELREMGVRESLLEMPL